MGEILNKLSQFLGVILPTFIVFLKIIENFIILVVSHYWQSNNNFNFNFVNTKFKNSLN